MALLQAQRLAKLAWCAVAHLLRRTYVGVLSCHISLRRASSIMGTCMGLCGIVCDASGWLGACIFCCRCWIFPLMQICLFSLFCYLTSSWLLQCYFFTSNDFYQTKLSLMITNIILVITSSHVIHSLYYIFKNWFTSIKKYFCFHCWLKHKLPRQMLYGNWTVFGMPKCTIDIRNLFPVQYSPHTKTSLPALRVLAQYTFHKQFLEYDISVVSTRILVLSKPKLVCSIRTTKKSP